MASNDEFLLALGNATEFSVGEPTNIRESKPNTNEALFSAFMTGVSANEFTSYEAICGQSPIKFGNKRVATLFFWSNSRRRCHLYAQLVLENGEVLAQFERQQSQGKVQIGWPSEIRIDMPPSQHHADVSSSPSGSFTRKDGSGNLDFNKVAFCGSPASMWCTLGALCCVPTLSILTIIACTKMASAPQQFNVTSTNSSAQFPTLEFRGVSSNTDHGNFEFGTDDSKLDLLLLVCARVASGVVTYEERNDSHIGDHMND